MFSESRKKKEHVISFNKKHNIDTTIPPWIIKSEGQTHYVQHIEVLSGFSTKETPLNEHTKASIKVRGILSIQNNKATIS